MTAQLNRVEPTASTEADSAQSARRSTPRWLRTVQLTSKTLVRVLRNSGFSVLVGWLSGYFFTVGNVASGKTPAEQSYASFVTANGAWFYGGFSTFMIIIFSIRLVPEKFVTRSALNLTASSDDEEPPSRTLSLPRCVMKLLWHMVPFLVVFTAAEVVSMYAVITYLPPSGRKYKPGMYVSSFWSNFILAGVEFCSRDIFARQTVRGLAHKHPKASSQQGKQSDNLTRHRSSRRSWILSIRRFLVIYVRTLPATVSSLIAIVYVHSISLFASINRESELITFAIGSIALKLTMQEVAKRCLLSTKKALSQRAMIVLVATPTILVDTQVRMLLMRLQDVSISVLGSALLALTEISVRGAKSMLVNREVKQMLKNRIAPELAGESHSQAPQGTEEQRTPVKTQSKRRTTKPVQATAEEIKAHQQRHLVVHTAEIYADMYAEYMAMGCSYAIMFFFWNHPQYQFVSTAVETSEATQRMNQFIIFAFQVGVEVVVDFFACNLEALQGVDFDSFDQNDSFLTFFMSMLAFSNVSISAGLYIHE